MKCNNRISEKLYKEYPRDFSIQDIDGLVRRFYRINNKSFKRFIIYESKNSFEKMGDAQRQGLHMLDEAIDWTKFDDMSGVYVIKIIDLENELIWYDLNDNEKFRTTFQELYHIFAPKDLVTV